MSYWTVIRILYSNAEQPHLRYGSVQRINPATPRRAPSGRHFGSGCGCPQRSLGGVLTRWRHTANVLAIFRTSFRSVDVLLTDKLTMNQLSVTFVLESRGHAKNSGPLGWLAPTFYKLKRRGAQPVLEKPRFCKKLLGFTSYFSFFS